MTKENSSVFRLGEILIQNKGVSWEQMQEALTIQRASGRLIGDILVEKGYVSLQNLYRALAAQYQMSFIEFEKLNIPPEVIKLLDNHTVYEYNLIPLILKNEVLLIAICDPRNIRPETELKKLFPNFEIRIAMAAPDDLAKALLKYYGPKK